MSNTESDEHPAPERARRAPPSRLPRAPAPRRTPVLPFAAGLAVGVVAALAASLLGSRRAQGLNAELEARCERREMIACRQLALSHQIGLDGPRDDKRAFELFERACNANDVTACLHFAKALEAERTGNVDQPRVIALYERACQGSQAEACAALGKRHEKGRGTAKSPEKALEYYQRRCDFGSAAP